MLPLQLKNITTDDLIANYKYRLKACVYEKIQSLTAVVGKSKEPVSYKDRLSLSYSEIKVGENWGEVFDCAWFNLKAKVDRRYLDRELVLIIDLNGEGLVYNDGQIVQSITNVSSEFDRSIDEPAKRIVPCRGIISESGEIDIWIDAGNNDLFGRFCENGVVKEMDVAVCNLKARDLYYDFEVIENYVKCVDPESAQYNYIVYNMSSAIAELSDFSDKALEKAKRYTQKVLDLGEKSILNISCIGHAHLDLAWLWPIRETIRKGARTFSTQLKNIENYDGYIFGASQAQLFEWMKIYYPDLYERIKKGVSSGRIDVQGGMWVESDTNIPSGESLVRQFLYGKEFFRQEFGKDVKNLWLPDVFGYSANMPQIIKKCGCDYFMTMKLSWNKYNRFPFNTFYWHGIDDTKVLAHMLPNGNYNSNITCADIKKTERNYSEAGIANDALLLFGIGDGGAGPSRKHLERFEREKNLKGLSNLEYSTAADFFEKLSRYEDLPDYRGELYLEKHNGVLSSQAKNKYYNRKSEFALHNLEFLLRNSKEKTQELDPIWKEILLYQFHDILPGSSIRRVYDESESRYGTIGETLREKTRALIENESENSVYGFNFTPFGQEKYIPKDGKLYRVCLDAYSSAEAECVPFPELNCSADILENDKVAFVFGKNGEVVKVVDKSENSECEFKGNVIKMYHDNGNCWDIESVAEQREAERFELVDCECFSDGADVVRRNYFEANGTKIVQTVRLSLGSEMLVFENECDFRAANKLVKVEFDTDFLSDAVYDIQFGKFKRAATSNNSIEYAQNEVCGHKYAYLDAPDGKFALLNDCKYGYNVKNGKMQLTLLRSQNYPCVAQDIGKHFFKYALMFTKDVGKIDAAAYLLNNEIILARSALKIEKPFVCDSENVICETIKAARYDDGVIYRFYESRGIRTKTSIGFGENAKVYECNLIEQDETELKELENIVFKPFEIKTFRVSVK